MTSEEIARDGWERLARHLCAAFTASQTSMSFAKAFRLIAEKEVGELWVTFAKFVVKFHDPDFQAEICDALEIVRARRRGRK